MSKQGKEFEIYLMNQLHFNEVTFDNNHNIKKQELSLMDWLKRIADITGRHPNISKNEIEELIILIHSQFSQQFPHIFVESVGQLNKHSPERYKHLIKIISK